MSEQAATGHSDLPAEFWTLMTARRHPASTFRMRNIDLSSLGRMKVQPLEILVVDTLAELCPDISWSATQVQSDGGIDFRGMGKSIHLNVKNQNIIFKYTIIGQIKRSSRYRMELLAGAFARVRQLVKLSGDTASQFLFVISTGKETIKKFIASAPGICHDNFPGIPLSIVNVDDLLSLWAQSNAARFEVLRPAFSVEEFERLRGHLMQAAAVQRLPQITIDCDVPAGRLVIGSDLQMTVTIRVAGTHPGQRIGVQFLPSAQIDLARPLALLGSPMSVTLNDRGFAQISLRIRPRAIGDVPLGDICVFHHGSSSSGQAVARHALGSVQVRPDELFRHVRFLRTPTAASANTLDRLASGAAARGMEIVAVLGPGGIGKSRLIDELFNSLHADMVSENRHLWSLIHVDHDTHRHASGRFLRDCLLGIAFPDMPLDSACFADPGPEVFRWLSRFVGAQEELVKSGIDGILKSDRSSSSDAAAFVILTALIARLREGPAALHLANMHWADTFEIEVLLELIHRLSALNGQLPRGLLLIVEGREGEMVERHAESDLTTNAWRRLYDSIETCTKVILPAWSAEHSRQFVSQLIEGLIGSSPTNRATERQILDHVLASSLGNPMQMIEHLRLLVDNRWLRIEENGSILFHPPQMLPVSLVELIAARVEFIDRSSKGGELVALLRLCAEIGLRTDVDLFDAMANTLSDSRLLPTLMQWQVARFPNAGTRDFVFLHEAYREAFRRIRWPGPIGEPLRQAALSRLAASSDLSPERVIAAAKLKQLDPGCDMIAIARDLEATRRRTSEPQAEIALCRELLQLPRHAVEHESGWFDLVCKLADLLILHGDWQEALQALERAREQMRRQSKSRSIELAELAHRFGNLLGDVHRMSDGLEAVEEGLATLNGSPGDRASDRGIRAYELLSNRLGVLRWFSGCADKGIGRQFQALRSALSYDPGGDRELLFACEVGMVMATRYPHRALQLLQRATTLLETLGDRCDPACDYARVQRDMVQLFLAQSPTAILCVRDNITEFLRSDRKPSIYAETLAWLTLGGCEFQLGRLEIAKTHFGEAIAAATKCRNLRVTWKAHLAYATAASELGHAREIGHARYAAELLVQSWENVSLDHRARWGQTIRLPLEQARRLCGRDDLLERTIATIDGGSPPPWIKDWESRPTNLSRPGQPFQILHVRSGQQDIFLMG